jgi:hypothetical protein
MTVLCPSLCRGARTALCLVLPALALPAQERLAVDRAFVAPPDLATIRVVPAPGAAAANWDWQVVEADGGSVLPNLTLVGQEPRSVECFYQPPAVTEPRTFHVRAVNRGNRNQVLEAAVRVRPEIERTIAELPLGKLNFKDGPARQSVLGMAGGLAWAEAGGGRPDLLVLDPRAKVVRNVQTGDQFVSTWLGQPGVRGHRDGVRQDARFDFPAYLAVRPRAEGQAVPWEAVISDLGSHVVRHVEKHGMVRTLSGLPYQPGFRDGDAAEAQFNCPLGVAMDPEGTVYVADLGNAVVRVIGRDGKVATLAGKPNEPGGEDGTGAAARFAGPRNLVRDPASGDLFCTDGCAVRRISAAGAVTTVLGVVSRQRHLDGKETRTTHPPAANLPLARVDCLECPLGLAISQGRLMIGDLASEGGQLFPLVRTYNLETGAFSTLPSNVSPERLFRHDQPQLAPALRYQANWGSRGFGPIWDLVAWPDGNLVGSCHRQVANFARKTLEPAADLMGVPGPSPRPAEAVRTIDEEEQRQLEAAIQASLAAVPAPVPARDREENKGEAPAVAPGGPAHPVMLPGDIPLQELQLQRQLLERFNQGGAAGCR